MARVAGNEASFATAVLTGLAAATGNPYPVTAANIQWIEQWIAREGGGGANNPLNTTQVTDTSTLLAGNSAGVRNYSSLDDGVNATVATLNNGRYANILSALRSGNALAADKAGTLSSDLLTWSGGMGPNGQANGKGYSTVAGTSATPSSSIGSGASSGQDFAQWLKATEPGLGLLIDDPQVGPLLEQFYANGAGWADQFQQQLSQTNWWKNTPVGERSLLAQQAADPSTAAQSIGIKSNYVTTLATKLGITLSAAQVQQIAQGWVANLGMSTDQIQQQVAALGNYAPGAKLSGTTLTDQQQLQGIYDAYAVPIDQATLSKQLQQIVASPDSATALSSAQSQIANQAKTLWASNPQLVQAITDGQTASQWAAPYLSHASTLLGVPTSNMSLNAPMWQAVLKPATDAQGKSTGAAMGIDQWDQQLRTNPTYGFDSSSTAIQEASNLATGLAQKLGFGA